ncbi:TonB-dependent receptor plug domain-containing protein [Hymenobacter norwichensis]|uniref:TonB-dependent receptor plug domain-containing protein n=1 Tax=Hymenobacter norwichensis TaxID=223903 RepID=UPI0003B77D44|nr:TonB-dependent receptor plug domain-containing protein [Hymenobacter norwichensis]
MKKLSLTFARITGALLLSASTNSYAQTALPQLSIGKPEPLVQPKNGQPAANSAPSTSIRLSHNTTLASRNPPLYVVDGTPITEERMKTLEPNLIEKIEVLKGSKAAVYGPSGLNGVILITMKK